MMMIVFKISALALALVATTAPANSCCFELFQIILFLHPAIPGLPRGVDMSLKHATGNVWSARVFRARGTMHSRRKQRRGEGL